MSIRDVIETLNQMETDGVIERYAIAGAVGATFYLEPVATYDAEVFIAFRPEPGKLLASDGACEGQSAAFAVPRRRRPRPQPVR
jgi:hypothetical protein